MSATIVILGATGDLTARYLLPAIAQLVERDLLDEDLRLVGVANDELDEAGFRDRVRGKLEDHAGGVDARGAGRGRRPRELRPRRRHGPRHPRPRPRPPRRRRRRRRALPRPAARAVPRRGRGAGYAGPARAAAGRRREAVRPGPRGRQAAQRRAGRRPARGAGLPRRPLPRQADGAQPPRPALRQPRARPDVDPRARREHRRRVRRDRRRQRARRLLRQVRRPAGHGAEPPAADADAHRDGAAASLDPHDLSERKVEVLRAVRTPTRDDVERDTVRARYTAGDGGDRREGARTSTPTSTRPGSTPARQTETYTEVVLHLDSPRWQDVPFRLRTGKALVGRPARGRLSTSARRSTRSSPDAPPNELRLELDPDRMVLLLNINGIGDPFDVETVGLDIDLPRQTAEPLRPAHPGDHRGRHPALGAGARGGGGVADRRADPRGVGGRRLADARVPRRQRRPAERGPAAAARPAGRGEPPVPEEPARLSPRCASVGRRVEGSAARRAAGGGRTRRSRRRTHR